MPTINNQLLLSLMAALAFLLGFFTFAMGVWILAFRAYSKDVQSLAAQTTQLVNKGLADDLAGLVGQTAELLAAVNQMVHTARGVGIFLILVGFLLMIAAGLLVSQVPAV